MNDHEHTPGEDFAADDTVGTTDAPSPHTRAGAPHPAFVALLRVLALGGLGVAGFLAWVHIDAWISQTMASAPGCAVSGLVDCNSVLNSPRWSNLLGMPVVVPAVLVYLLMNAAVWMLSPRRSEAQLRLVWFVLYLGAAAIAAAAIWFVYVQLAIIGRVCTWCMVEHAIGVTLALLVWVYGGAVGTLAAPRRLAAAGLGLLGVAALIGGQFLQTPAYTEPVAIGELEFVRGEHPVVGLINAPHMIVEALDYTCPRCRKAYGLLEHARHQLGPDYAITVLTFPLSHKCNPVYESTDSRHRNACELARLAHAVWLADPHRFEEMHALLFLKQHEMSVDAARSFAVELVGAETLDRALSEVDARDLIKRDVDRATAMDVRNLPGLFVGGVRFNALPEDANEMARLIHLSFHAQPPSDAPTD